MVRRKSSDDDIPEKVRPRPVRFEDIVGHAAQIAYLTRALERGVLPQAILLTGPAGIGKHTMAFAAAAALECETGGGGACGACGPCRKVAGGLHPDLREIGLPVEGGRQKSQIVIAQIREDVIKPLELPPYEGKRLVFVIDPADALNTSAQNALLKSLEEPPAYANFLLVTSNPAGLLPTVRSRCHEVTLHPLPAEAMTRFIESRGLHVEDQAAALGMAAGSPARLLTMDAGDSLARIRAALGLLKDGLSAKAYADLAPGIEAMAKSDTKEVLALVLELVRDALRVAHGRPPAVHRSLADDLGAVVEARGIDGLQTVGDRLRDAPSHLARNVNARLMWERIFLVP